MTSTIEAAPGRLAGSARRQPAEESGGGTRYAHPGFKDARGSSWPIPAQRSRRRGWTSSLDPAAPYGYTRAATLQAQFEQSAARLLASDGWSGGGAPELVADLALEGGGVKGIGIVGAVSVLAEAGYRFARVAGTSAGSIAAALIAAISKKGAPMTSLKGYLDDLTFTEFMQPKGRLHEFMDHHFGNAGEKLSDAAVLTHRMGVYDGNFLGTWLGPIMDDLGVHTFADLKITLEDDPGMSLPASRRYRLVVHTSDITRGQLVRLPWDYDFYGQNRDEQDVVRRGARLHVHPVLLRAGHLHGPAGRRRHPRPGRGLHPHPLRRWHGDLGRRRHAAQLPDQRLRPGGRRTAALADHRRQAVVAADAGSPPRRPPGPPTSRRGAACTP